MATVQSFVSGAISKTINMPTTRPSRTHGRPMNCPLARIKATPRTMTDRNSRAPRVRPGRDDDEPKKVLTNGSLAGKLPPSSPRGRREGDHQGNRHSQPRNCRNVARATPRRPSSAGTRSICAPASTRTAAGRDLHRHAQGRCRLPRDDEQLRHRRLDRPAIRRAPGEFVDAFIFAALNRRHGTGQRPIKNTTSILDYIFRELAVSYLTAPTWPMSPRKVPRFDDLGRGEEEGSATSRSAEPRPRSRWRS